MAVLSSFTETFRLRAVPSRDACLHSSSDEEAAKNPASRMLSWFGGGVRMADRSPVAAPSAVDRAISSGSIRYFYMANAASLARFRVDQREIAQASGLLTLNSDRSASG